jgi:hypothetical protein
MRLVELFEYECTSYDVVDNSTRVNVHARPLHPEGKVAGANLPSVQFRAKRLIYADGGNIPHKAPFEFSTSAPIHSITPAMCLTPEMNTRMTIAAETRDKPIWVIGSGKTAVDVMKGLNKLEGVQGRLRCISGRGTTFINRTKIAHTKFKDTHMLGGDMAPDNLLKFTKSYHHGVNDLNDVDWQDVSKQMHKEGLLHTFCENPQSSTTYLHCLPTVLSTCLPPHPIYILTYLLTVIIIGFMLGICSPAEMQMVKDALHPREKNIVKAHLVDIIDGDAGIPQMKMRTVDTKEIFYRPIKTGSFIINCTDHFLPVNYQPVLTPDNLVLRPQMLAGFTGPSANVGVHLWFRGQLEGLWQKIPRFELDHSNKLKMGFEAGSGVILNMQLLRQKLPFLVAEKYVPVGLENYAYHRVALLGLRLFGSGDMASMMAKHVHLHKMRYTDVDDGASYEKAGNGNYAYGQLGVNPKSRL